MTRSDKSFIEPAKLGSFDKGFFLYSHRKYKSLVKLKSRMIILLVERNKSLFKALARGGWDAVLNQFTLLSK